MVAGLTVGVFTALWAVLHSRRNLRRVYEPRALLAPTEKRPQDLPSGAGFWKTVFALPDQEIIVANGPDAYFFLRFIKVFGIHMLLPYFVLTFAICIPLA